MTHDKDSSISSHSSRSDMLALARHLSKPKSELQPFSGDPLQFNRFLRQFNSKVVANCDDYEERLNYLEQYTRGEAQQIVIGFSYLDAAKGYTAAMQELAEKYGDQDIIVNAFLNKALSWPPVKADNPRELDRFSVFLTECENAINSIDAMKVLEYTDNMKKIVSKLPYHMHDRWRSVVYKAKEDGDRVTFKQLVKYVKTEAKKATDPSYGREALAKMSADQKQAPSKQKYKTFAASAKFKQTEHLVGTSSSNVVPSGNNLANKRNAFTKPCVYCQGAHALESCDNLFKLPFYERTDVLKVKGFCFSCLLYGHHRRDCRNKARCRHCNGRHPSVLHVDGHIPRRVDVTGNFNRPSVASPTSDEKVTSQAERHTGAGEEDVTLAIVPVKVKLRDSSRCVDTYAFLDSGSNVSFCTESLMQKLGCRGKRRQMKLNTMGDSHTMYTYEINNLEVCDLSLQSTVRIPAIYSKSSLPVSHRHIPTSDDIHKFPHLADIDLPSINSGIDLLIGNNIADAYTPLEVRVGPSGTPYASRTRLGWVAWNVIRPGGELLNISNLADVLAIEELEDSRRLEILYNKSLMIDFPEISGQEKAEHSIEDKTFLQKMADSKMIIDGHYQFSLPLRKESTLFPDNTSQALQRLNSLKKKLTSNSNFHEDYTRFMTDLLDRGYAEEVDADDTSGQIGRIWYLPHHGVYHPHKPSKIRIVFDCSAKCKGVSLNSMLLSGPDMTSNLLGVLLRFRLEEVAVIGDVECMFYQVKVSPADRDLLRFFWWPNGNLDLPPKICRMKVHLFGASSSPSCANYALQQVVHDNSEYFRPEVSTSILHNFYVDDLLCSFPTPADAIQMIEDISFMCTLGGFHLTKWLSNAREVIEVVPESERAKSMKDLSFDSFPDDRALGVHWKLQTDSFGFNVAVTDAKPTRRNLLSITSSVYDPLGLASPFVMTAKAILQDACLLNLDWDDKLPESLLQKWTVWLEELPYLKDLSLPRCFKPPHFGKVTSIQLHHFADASETGYGIVSYIRQINDHGDIHCSFVVSRSRVAPLKRITIPRMELTAAVLAVKMDATLCKELTLPSHLSVFWTDSMTVLRYIANTSTRFQTFVANRISLIRDYSHLSQWRYVESSLNPADVASRGSTIQKLKHSPHWFQGPSFMWQDENTWPCQPTGMKHLPDADPEVKISSVSVAQPEDMSPISRLLHRSSSWLKAKRVTAWILHMMSVLRSWVTQRKQYTLQIQVSTSDQHTLNLLVDDKMQKLKKESSTMQQVVHIHVDVIQAAELLLIRHEQQHHYPNEMTALSSDNVTSVKSSSDLIKLDPMFQDGFLRVGGRISQSNIPFESKHQIIIPKKSQAAMLILHDIHKKVGHLGKNTMIAELRKSFWIPQVGTLVKSIVSKCVTCKRYRGRSCIQKMGDLPESRVVPDLPAFSYVGADYFGPIEVKRGRATVKRYGVLFTCFTSRATHLEVAYSLDTDSCINAIRRFIARRGTVKSIRSDNGTNLVGAERELRTSMEQWNQQKISRYLHQSGIKWEFNPPSASHFGGVWESLIRVVRKIMYSLLHEQVLHMDDEGLQTLLCEVENIMNSRPISSVSNNPDDLDALTPNHLLHLQPDRSLPCGIFSKSDCYVRRRWCQIQYLADVFWKRWHLQYLHLLQERQKWYKPTRNIKIGDIVMLVDNHRNSWIIGRILSTTVDKKGLVRVVKVQTPHGVFSRPIHKLSLILEADCV